jgi:O-antigen/teichoic acid export membrane protein
MMEKRQVFINAIMVEIQIVVVSIVLIILYRFLLDTIGVEQLGIWSVVLATTSLTQVANLGLSGGVVKFVAKYISRGESENVSGVIQTATLSVATFVGIILLASYPLIKWLLRLVIPNQSLSLAFAILPYALLSLWIMLVSSIFQAGLDGYQRFDIRSLLIITGAIIHLLLCFVLAPTYGLIGVAYARVVQNIVILLCSWVLLRRYLPVLPFFPCSWDRKIFREIIGYGLNFQIISITIMLYDPITKGLLSKFGGLSMVGYYEMAHKMIQQFRGLIVSANQVLVPPIAALHEKTPEKIQSVYLGSYQLLFYLAFPLYSLVIICTPTISRLWIGHYENTFVIFGFLLAIGWLVNTLAAPAFFANLGIGKLRWNVIGHIAIAVLNAALGFVSGKLFGGLGVVIAWVISLAAGSSIVYISYHIEHKIPVIELLPKASRKIFIACLSGIILSAFVHKQYSQLVNIMQLNAMIFIPFAIVLSVFLWFHPLRNRVIGWITNDLFNRKT